MPDTVTSSPTCHHLKLVMGKAVEKGTDKTE
jgi:hypothetical protein